VSSSTWSFSQQTYRSELLPLEAYLQHKMSRPSSPGSDSTSDTELGSEHSQELPDRVAAFTPSSPQNTPGLPNGVCATESTDDAATTDR